MSPSARVGVLGQAALLAIAACTEAPPQSPHDTDRFTLDVRSPDAVTYVPSLLGTGPMPLTVTVANQSDEMLDVSALALRIEATQAGLALRCDEQAEGRRAEPTQLAPGKSFTFRRELDCRLPLAGTYAVAVAVAFGRERTWRTVRSYALDVSAPEGLEPRALDDTGLFATIGAAPLAGAPTKGGHPRAAIALTHTGPTPLELPPMRVETRVRRSDTPWACTSKSAMLATPPALAPGAVYREPFDVTCLGLDVPGIYDVEVLLWMGRSSPAARTAALGERAVPLGHLRIEVEDDPARLRVLP